MQFAAVQRLVRDPRGPDCGPAKTAGRPVHRGPEGAGAEKMEGLAVARKGPSITMSNPPMGRSDIMFARVIVDRVDESCTKRAL